MKKFFYLLFAIVLTAFAVTFALENTQLVKLSYHGLIDLEAALYWVIVGVLFIGMLIGYICGLLGRFKVRRENRRLKKQTVGLQNQIEKLKTS